MSTETSKKVLNKCGYAENLLGSDEGSERCAGMSFNSMSPPSGRTFSGPADSVRLRALKNIENLCFFNQGGKNDLLLFHSSEFQVILNEEVNGRFRASVMTHYPPESSFSRSSFCTILFGFGGPVHLR